MSAFGVILALATIGVITYSVFNSDAFDTSLSSAMGELKELSAGNGKETGDVPQENEDDGVALYESGMKYYNGDGVKQDFDKAVDLFKQAIDKGNVEALVSLGVCYYNGTGVKQDDGKTFKLWQQAANKGNATAQCFLGACYYDAVGVKQDKDKAVEYFRLAAAGGNGDAAEWLKSQGYDDSTGQAAGADDGQEAAAEEEGEMGQFTDYVRTHIVDGIVRSDDVSKEAIQESISNVVYKTASAELAEREADMFAEVNTYLTEAGDGEYEGDIVISYMNPPSDLSWRAKAHVTARVIPRKIPKCFVWKLVP